MIRLHRHGISGSLNAAERARLKKRFDTDHALSLRGFMAAPLLATIQEKLRKVEFRDRPSFGGKDVRQNPTDPATSVFFWMLLTDPRLFKWVEDLTGLGPITSLTGNVYRTIPGMPHRLDWHQDLEEGERIAAMTFNLSPRPVRGGLLEMRMKADRKPVAKLAYARAGDAILFRVRPDIEHRSTKLEGDAPKLVYVCWFQRGRS